MGLLVVNISCQKKSNTISNDKQINTLLKNSIDGASASKYALKLSSQLYFYLIIKLFLLSLLVKTKVYYFSLRRSYWDILILVCYRSVRAMLKLNIPKNNVRNIEKIIYELNLKWGCFDNTYLQLMLS